MVRRSQSGATTSGKEADVDNLHGGRNACWQGVLRFASPAGSKSNSGRTNSALRVSVGRRLHQIIGRACPHIPAPCELQQALLVVRVIA
jgi:hypothetical protein